ncbi:MAG: ATP-dependent DNA helicase PcrA [Firmicutes bacterium HGW-Firmicutes-21]|nr:MAG: ATP-dependent DNA helicase PcrA [Firmicutes bacterium HGW-Firmicutes-21]
MKKEEFLNIKRNLFDKYYGGLNEMQRRAVYCVNGPLLVLAGAGSGKTTVLVNRIANIISCGNAYESDFVPKDSSALITKMKQLAENGTREQIHEFLPTVAENPAEPYQVLCITFTNKAASEFKERLKKLLGNAADDIWAGTFHSICVRILRRHINLIGYENGFTIYDSDDSKRLISDILKRLNIDENLLTVRTALNTISRAKEEGVFPKEFAESGGNDNRMQKIAAVYTEYQGNLQRSNALDFDDIIMLTNLLFDIHPAILDKYTRQFEYILVDEYQDTNLSQSRLITLLAGEKRNVCVVGDDDQSIYAFRGATVENILSFDSTFRNARVVKLEQNYRSTGNILAAANGLIKNNTGRKGKNLWTDEGEGDPVLQKKQSTQSDEATFIVNFIRSRVASHEYKYGDFAILYRMNAQSNALEIIFSKSKIPYRIFGGVRFYERKEIKDIIAYLSVINNPSDDTRLRRIINVPRRQIGPNTLALLDEISQRENKSVFHIIKNASDYPDLQKSIPKLERFYSLIAELRSFSQTASLSELIKEVVIRTAYKEMLTEDETDMTRADNVDELVSSAIAFEESVSEPTLSAFLEDIALVSDTDNFDSTADAVTLMTVHSAKGLEFPVVFLPGFEEGIFPSVQSITEGEKALEEERRLAYVAVTRAKRKLVILHTNTRLLFGRTSSNPVSRFADEIPNDCKIVDDKPQATVTTVSEAKKKYSNSQVSFLKNIGYSQNTQEDVEQKQFSAGTKVEHAMFGTGTVMSAEKMGGDILYEIEFDSGSVKRLMGTYAKLTKV